ncbi:MAG: LuxR C-terminal-related transcriptional regulator [bacterium]
MVTSEIVRKIEKGKVVCLDKEQEIGILQWNAHPAFKGVFFKHLIKAESTNSKFSCSLVRIDAGYEISEHIHEDRWELHEIISGIGKGILKDKEIQYAPHISVVIPEGIKHKVIADKEDLYLMSNRLTNFSNGTLFSIAGESIEHNKRTEAIFQHIVPHFHQAFIPAISEKQKKGILSQREKEVINWVKEGKTSWEISKILNISERTVNFHLSNIMQKLDAVNRTQAVAVAFEQGLINIG